MRRATIPWGWGTTSLSRPGGPGQAAGLHVQPAQPGDAMATSHLLSARGERVMLAALLALAAFLNIFRLSDAGYGNLYYAATVKSMLTSWHAFFYASFDAGGFVTVDKPPLGFWIQAASAKLFGFSGLSLLLPEAIAGVLSVALIYVLVRRSFGAIAGLLAALILALSPVAVAINRNNTIDALLILTLLGAVWCVLRAIEHSSLRWLAAGAVLVGLGFNIKMLQAYLVVPALYLAYLLGSRLPWRMRIVHLAVATLALLVASFSWAVAVDLTPATQRPYVGSSEDNSVLNLALGYNGLLRLLPSDWLPSALSGSFGGGNGGGTAARGNPSGMPGFGEDGPSALRLFGRHLAGQISWLLPLAVIGAAAAWWQTRARLPLSLRQTALAFWGMWLATGVSFFSVATSFTVMHRYYLAMLAPPIAVLAGTGLVALWRDYRRHGWRGWLLPCVVLCTVALQVKILADYSDWSGRLAPVIAVLGMLAALGLVLLRRPNISADLQHRLLPVVAAAGLVAILAAPAAWAGITVWESNALLPAAGPAESFGPPGMAIPTSDTEAAQAGETVEQPVRERNPRRGGGPRGEADAKLIAYLQANRDGERFLFATTNANSAAPYILATGEAVAALGGFIGGDPILTAEALAAMIANGEARFFSIPSVDEEDESDAASATQGRMSGDPFAENANVRWINDHCAAVPRGEWQSAADDSGGPFGFDQVLFDCADA